MNTGLFGGATVNSDQVLQFVLAAGSTLSEKHCGMFLLFLGRLHPRQRTEGEGVDFLSLLHLPLSQREAGSKLDTGPDSEQEPAVALLQAFYSAWILGVSLRILP
jgi:hypothetical protein